MKNSYLNTVLSIRSRITTERLVQFTFLTLEEHYVNFMKEFDYFMYKDFENLLKRSVKICDMLLLLSPKLNISFKSKKFDIVVDKFNFHLDAVQQEFKLDYSDRTVNLTVNIADGTHTIVTGEIDTFKDAVS